MPIAWEPSHEDALAKARASGRLAMLLFHSPH
jgi:hypothetical protein